MDEYRCVDAEPNTLMIARLKAFADLNLNSPAAYIDTDMIFLREVDPEMILQGSQVGVCRRSFENDRMWDTNFRGIDLSEYEGKPLGKVYPYVACFTVTRGAGFWRACLEELESLDHKFHIWYGDQEAIRNVIHRKIFDYRELPESVYACLPEKQGQQTAKARVLHFKWARRKKIMLELAMRQGLMKM